MDIQIAVQLTSWMPTILCNSAARFSSYDFPIHCPLQYVLNTLSDKKNTMMSRGYTYVLNY